MVVSVRRAWAGPTGSAQASPFQPGAANTDHARGVATREELERLVADRHNDLPVPALTHPAPSWVHNPEDPERARIRMRERRIRYLERQLHSAARTL